MLFPAQLTCREQHAASISDADWLLWVHSLSGRAEQVEISVVEIYCEVIKDLLSTSPGSAGLTVQQDREHGLVIAGAIKVGSFHVIEVLNRNRIACDQTQAATSCATDNLSVIAYF